MNIERGKTQWCSLSLILTTTVGVNSCGTILIPDVINNLMIKNAADSGTVIKE